MTGRFAGMTRLVAGLIRLALLLLSGALLAAPATLHAQVVPPTPGDTGQARKPDQLRTLSRDELDVIKVLTNQERAWNLGDLLGYASGYKDSPETLFISSQVNRGYAQMLADYRKNYPNKDAMGTLAFSELEPRILDEHYAVVTGKYHLDRSRKAGGPADGIFSLVFEKTGKGWKIIVDHTT